MFVQSYIKSKNKQAKKELVLGPTQQPKQGQKKPDTRGPFLDTLAQLRKGPETEAYRGSKNTLLKRARSKYLSNNLALKLKDLRSDLEASYFRTYGCASLLEQRNGEITGKYCNNRWCLVCNRIRTAKLIKGYKKPLSELKDPYFVTLTTVNPKGADLRPFIKGMIKNIRLIKDTARKAGISLRGLRKLECTYNAQRGDYNPHFHLIIEGKEAANYMLFEWLKRYPTASKSAQDIQPANEESMFELFKYFTKVIHKDNTYISALDIIFMAMRGLRVFQPMGIKKVSEDITDIEATIKDLEQREALWLWVENDWIDIATGETLTGYNPSDQIKELIKRFKMPKKAPT